MNAREIPATDKHPGDLAMSISIADTGDGIGARFERIVEAYGGHRALRWPGGALTYNVLNRWANQAAHTVLKYGGVGEPGRVGLLCSHGAPAAAGQLGVIKSGWCSVPLDPFQPDARLEEILEDADCGLLFSDLQHFQRAQRLAGSQGLVFSLEAFGEAIPQENPGLVMRPDDVANLVYTSGSTGEPKGVMQTHRQILRSIAVFSKQFGVTAEDRIPLLALITSSQGTSSSLVTLLNGAELQMYSIREMGIDRLGAWLTANEATVLIVAASVFRRFVASLDEGVRFPALRVLRLGSEPVYANDIECWRRLCGPACVFLNALSSSETGNIAMWRLAWEDEYSGENVPAGFAAEGVEILLTDESGREAAQGTEGEIVVRSRYLSLGYWRKPELTQAAFRACQDRPGMRYFRSGDVGVRREDGSLEVRGRKDLRIKVRGFRVEPAEVEAALERHPGVAQAVVVSREVRKGEARLAACLVSSEPAVPDDAALRAYLRARLPEWMTPSDFVWVESLPRTANGKADRRAALALILEARSLADSGIQPRTDLEDHVRRIWQEVLVGADEGLQENFFDSGGDSLTAGRVVARVSESLDVEIPVGEFLEEPTLSGLAQMIERRRSQTAASGDSSLLPTPRTGDEPVSFAQQRLWFLHHWEPAGEAYNLPRAYRLCGLLDGAALRKALTEVVRRHETLRTTFEERDGVPVQRIGASVPFELPMLDLSSVPESERAAAARRVVEEESRKPFDLEKGPIFRGLLVRLGERDYVLFLTLHHIVSDRWSRGILNAELTELYASTVEGRIPRLKDLPIQYADYARWERRLWESGGMSRDLAYWRGELAGLRAELVLPVDRPQAREPGGRGSVLQMRISNELSQGLRHLSKRAGVTLFMTLLSGFYGLLHRMTGAADILVGTTVANRGRIEIEGLIGFFVNTVVLRGRINEGLTFRGLLDQTRNKALEAYEHQRLPFDRLVADLRVERELYGTPLIQVMFGLRNAPGQPLKLKGLDTERWETGTGTSKFALSLNLFTQSDSLFALWEYSSELFDAATIEKMHLRYVSILEEMSENQDRLVAGTQPALREPD